LKTILYTLPDLSNPKEIEHIISMFNEGLDVLHIRKPSLEYKSFEEFISLIPNELHPKIIIHSHYSLLDKYKLKGIHFTEKSKGFGYLQNLKVKKFRRMYKEIFISAAFHSLKDLTKNFRLYDYVTLSPIFKSISKKNYIAKSTIQLRDVEDLIRKKQIKIIALGGIDHIKIPVIKETGFYGVALMGSIWQSENPTEYFRTIKCTIDQKGVDPFFL